MVGSGANDEDAGIIPRSLNYIFDRLQSHKQNLQQAQQQADASNPTNLMSVLALKVSFLEIYNDECKDLLHPEVPSRDIVIREDKDGKIFFTGAREEIVHSVEDAMYCLNAGARARTTAETFMNAASSRSHVCFIPFTKYLLARLNCVILYVGNIYDFTGVVSIFGKCGKLANSSNVSFIIRTISFYQPKLKATAGAGAGAGALIQSKLHLVDLAGSERAKRTHATGTRLKESVGINQVSFRLCTMCNDHVLMLGMDRRQGLLALGKVIRALTTATPSAHVPYR
jgi:hypothetical protein